MVITRKSQVLLNVLDVRVVVNDRIICPLRRKGPVMITLAQQPYSIVATDGYHITPPLQVLCYPRQVCHLQVECAIHDGLLYAGAVLLVAFAVVGIDSDVLLLKLLSFFPLFYFLYQYYIRRSSFLQIRAVG